MLEDKALLWRSKHGSSSAFSRLYKKYESYLLTLAANLLADSTMAEDVVQDVFVRFIQSAETFKLTGSLKAYLATCVANRARDYLRKKQRRKTVDVNRAENITSDTDGPVQLIIKTEQLEKLADAMTMLPYEQREVIVLRLHGQMKFDRIARLQETSLRTVHSRYRYGLNKLRSILNGEVKK